MQIKWCPRGHKSCALAAVLALKVKGQGQMSSLPLLEEPRPYYNTSSISDQ